MISRWCAHRSVSGLIEGVSRSAAARALSELQRLSYAKTKSDAVAKLEGTWNEQTKEKRKEQSAAAQSMSLSFCCFTRFCLTQQQCTFGLSCQSSVLDSQQ